MGALFVLGAVSVSMILGVAVSRGLLELVLSVIPSSSSLRGPGPDA